MVGYSYKVTSTLANGVPNSVSNYIYRTAYNNGVYDIYNIIEDADGDAETAARMLTAHKDILRRFVPFRTFKGGYILCAIDALGNKSFMTVKKEDK